MKFLVTNADGQLVKVTYCSIVQRIFTYSEDWATFIVFEDPKGKQDKFNLHYILKVELIK